jgi:hypothetical protein
VPGWQAVRNAGENSPPGFGLIAHGVHLLGDRITHGGAPSSPTHTFVLYDTILQRSDQGAKGCPRVRHARKSQATNAKRMGAGGRRGEWPDRLWVDPEAPAILQDTRKFCNQGEHRAKPLPAGGRPANHGAMKSKQLLCALPVLLLLAALAGCSSPPLQQSTDEVKFNDALAALLSSSGPLLPTQHPGAPNRVAEIKGKAEAGDAKAQCSLGLCYNHGVGVIQDMVEAVKWYREAAEQGLAQAQCNLGVCYDNGEGVAQDAAEAVRWYRKAAERGYADAQCNLGACYYNGEGVAQDDVQAHKWFSLASAQGDEDATKNLAMAEKRMGTKQVSAAQQLAREFKLRSTRVRGASHLNQPLKP